MSKTSPLIQLSDINLTLSSTAGPVPILKTINLSVNQGEALAIAGASGSGKTSILMIMSGLERPTSGSVSVAGCHLSAMNEKALSNFRREKIGIIFQSFHLLPTMNVLENVAVALEFRGVPHALEIAKAQIDRVGLSHRLDHYPSQLSGGEQQRVAIARALASGAKILLADEPTGNLDHKTGARIIELLFALNKADGVTLVLITHDQTLAQRCNRAAAVADGLIISGNHSCV